MKFIKNKICVFDFDGVIVNSRKVGYAIHNSIREKYGLPPIESQNDYLRIIDNGCIKKFLDPDRIKNYYLECNVCYKSYLNEIEMFYALKNLFQNTTEEIIIISSSPDCIIRKVLKNNEIERVSIYGKEKAKTKIERFALLLRDKNIKNDDIIYIGDTIDDYNFCKQVGVPMVGSNYGYSNLSKIKDLLSKLVEQPEELVESIKQYMLIR